MPFAVYHRWPSINNSSLEPALVSGKHYEVAEPQAATPAMELGTVVHTLVLRPAEVDSVFAVVPDYTQQLRFDYPRAPERSNEYRGLRDAWEEEHAGKIWLTEERAERARESAKALIAELGDWLEQAKLEVAVVAKCPETGLRRKAMIDLLMDDRIVDVKTTDNIAGFERDCERFDYWRQAAFYQDIVRTLTKKTLPVWLVAQETVKPYCTVAAEVDCRAIEDGRCRYLRALRRIKRGRDTGHFEGLPPQGKWRRRQDRDVLELDIDGQSIELR